VGIPLGLHPTVGAAGGGCIRSDPNLGSTDWCGEILGGFDWVFYPRFHLALEGGLGIMGKSTFGYPDLGVAQSSGGFYVTARTQLGYDVTDYYYLRGGVQLKETYLLSWLASGVDFAGEIGTRFFERKFELGTGVFVGADGASTGGLGGNSESSFIPAFGVTLNARYVFR
jgi:hypothetical protein